MQARTVASDGAATDLHGNPRHALATLAHMTVPLGDLRHAHRHQAVAAQGDGVCREEGKPTDPARPEVDVNHRVLLCCVALQDVALLRRYLPHPSKAAHVTIKSHRSLRPHACQELLTRMTRSQVIRIVSCALCRIF